MMENENWLYKITLSLENVFLVLSNVDKIIETQQTHFLFREGLSILIDFL